MKRSLKDKNMIGIAMLLGLLTINTNCYAGRLNLLVVTMSKSLIQPLLTQFQKTNKATTVVPTYISSAKDLLGVLNNNMPDVFIGSNQILTEYGDLGLFADVGKILNSREIKDFVPSLLDTYYSNGATYALPIGGRVETVAYNKTFFSKAGLSEPQDSWTWYGNFYEVARKLTRDKNGDGIPDQYSIGTTYPYQFLSAIHSNGGSLVDREFKRILYTRKQSLEAIEFILKLYRENLVQPNPNTFRYEDLLTWAFYDGKSAMVIEGYNSSTKPDLEYQKYLKSKGFEYERGVVSIPKGNSGSVPILSSYSAGLMEKSKKKAEAVAFIRYLANKDGQLTFFDTQHWLPATYTGLNTQKVADWTGPKLLGSYRNGKSRSARKAFINIDNLLFWDIDKVIKGELTIRDIIDNAKAKSEDILKQASYATF